MSKKPKAESQKPEYVKGSTFHNPSADGSSSSGSELEQLERQVGELTEALQRERADSDNIRRRHDEQMATVKTLVKTNVVRELLPIIDNCERLLDHISTLSKEAPWKQGVKQTVKQMRDTLEKMGVERIKTVGEVFDPKYHEAVVMEDGDGTVEVISEELQAGYVLGDEIIRHAMVKVKMQSTSKLANKEEEKKK